MKIGIFGGSFNPVHRGHFEIVNQVLLSEKVDHVIVVPAYQNPLKNTLPVLPEKLRWEMLCATFSSLDNVGISDFELSRPKLSYTYKTLEFLQKSYPEDQLYLMMGEDSFAQFHLWREVGKITKLVDLLIFRRPALRKKVIPPIVKTTNVEWAQVRIPKISSTEIRGTTTEKVEEKKWLHPDALSIWKRYKNS